MTGTTVPDVLDRLGEEMAAMSPQLRKAAAFVLDHPGDVGVSSVRELATAAGVKPNSFVRMARVIGYDGFDDFREPFRQQVRYTTASFQDRAQWLQAMSAEGQLGQLYADVAGSILENIERTFAGLDADVLKDIADAIVDSRRTFVVGVGANYALAHNFAYLVGMALDNVVAVPGEGNVPMDSIVRAGKADVVIGMTFEPYRSEVVETIQTAKRQGSTIVAISDSHGSPIAVEADHVVIAPSETPEFFPSTLAAAAVLEVLASFIVADSPAEVISAIDRFHARRYDLGVYWKDQ